MNSIDNKNPESWIPKDLFMLYCGDNKLEKFYEKAVAKKNINQVKFNLVAILFPPLWFSSRKQWLVLLYFSFIIFLDTFLETYFNKAFPASAYVLLSIIPAFLSYSIILRMANYKYYNLKAKGLSQEDIKLGLKDKAKQSYKSAILGILAWVFSIYLIILIL